MLRCQNLPVKYKNTPNTARVMFQGNHMRQKASRRLFKDISHSPSFFTQSPAFVRAYEPPSIRAPSASVLCQMVSSSLTVSGAPQAVGDGLGKASSAFGKGFGPAQVGIMAVMSPSPMRT